MFEGFRKTREGFRRLPGTERLEFGLMMSIMVLGMTGVLAILFS